jgi:hypothetical protein
VALAELIGKLFRSLRSISRESNGAWADQKANLLRKVWTHKAAPQRLNLTRPKISYRARERARLEVEHCSYASENTPGSAVSCIARLDAFNGLVPGFQPGCKLVQSIGSKKSVGLAQGFLREPAFCTADVTNNQMSYEGRDGNDLTPTARPQ